MAKKPLSRLIDILRGAATYGADGLSLESGVSKLEKFAHFWVLVWKSFVRNRCPVRASALSYTTLLALIPMLAVAMSVSSFFLKTKSEEQIKTFVEQFIDHLVPIKVGMTDDPETWEVYPINPTNAIVQAVAGGTNLVTEPPDTNAVVAAVPATTNAPVAAVGDGRISDAKKRAAGYIYDFIQSTQSGKLGLVAVLVLLWTTILMLTRVEETFNDIWGVVQGRNWIMRIVLYWAAMTLGTMLIMAAIGLSSGPYFQKTRSVLGAVPYLEPLLSQLLPVVLICATFAMFYRLMPNTKVNFSAACVGGALAGTTWHLFNIISLRLATNAVTASKIYGSLALVPLIMLGLYTVWVIVLFGAQVAYAFQNRESYLQDKLAENVNQRGREFVALRLMTCIGQRFQRGLPAATIQVISNELGVPSRLVQQVLQTLLAARLVVEVAGGELAYAPARPLEAINAHHILIAMRATHGQDFITYDEPVRAEVYGEFARIQEAERQAASSVTMLALVNRAQARLEIASPFTHEEALQPAPVPAPTSEHDETRVFPLNAETENPPTAATEPVTADLPSTEPKQETTATETANRTTGTEFQTASAAAEPSTDDDRGFPL